MKKIILFILILLLGGCSVKYHVSYENNVLKENFSIRQDKTGSDIPLSLKEFYKDKDKLKDHLNYDLNYEEVYENNKAYEVLSGSFTHDNLNSIKNSYPVKECFRTSDITIKNDLLTVDLRNPHDCLFLSELDFTFKTDKYINFSNASFKDKGFLRWKTLDKGIYFQVDLKKNATYKERNPLITNIIRIVMAFSILVIGLIVINKLRRKVEG